MRIRRPSLLTPAPALAVAALAAAASPFLATPGLAAENVYLRDVPDYAWEFGCFGTACGNLIGYWDRHGFPNFYTGPTAGGVAPLNSFGNNAGIRSLWASEAGFDGRPANQPGHVDDYYDYYESTQRDPYARAGRAEHAPDCIGDFIGLNQSKWPDLGGECSGNIDGFSFNFFDRSGARRSNFTPASTASTAGGLPDIQSGLRAWAASRGYAADSFSQLSDFNPDKTGSQGFTFADLRAEIDAGFPVLLFMQPYGEFARTVDGKTHQNPEIHALLAYGYVVDDDGQGYVRYRTSWASGDREFSPWTSENWTPENQLFLPLRGVIGFHPRPRLTRIQRQSNVVHLAWDGPTGTLHDDTTDSDRPACRYLVEQADSPDASSWTALGEPTTTHSATVPACCADTVFFRVRLVGANE